MADIGQTMFVTNVGIEQVVCYTATQFQTAIKALERIRMVGERTVGCMLSEILNLAPYPTGHISTKKRFDGCAAINGQFVFQHQRQLKIVEIVSELRMAAIALAGSSLLTVANDGPTRKPK